MTLDHGCRIVDENLRLALRFFGRASGRGAVEERDGLLLIDSGVNYAVFNIAVISAPVANLARLELLIGVAAEWYASRRIRWSLWCCDDYVAELPRRGLAELLHRHRLRPLTAAPGMLADAVAPPVRSLPRLECRLVDDAQTRLDFAHLTTLSFDIPFTTARSIYEPAEAWMGDYVGYVGYANRRAVATAAVVITSDAIGLYSVSTVPEMRHRGYAEALMRWAIQQANEVSGIERTVLQATRAGRPMYQKMGYRDVTNYSVHIL